MANELELAYDHCQRITKEYAQNFYYAFRTLPARKRRAIYAAYAFCRACDDIADEDLPLDEKRRLFAQTRQSLLRSQRRSPPLSGEGDGNGDLPAMDAPGSRLAGDSGSGDLVFTALGDMCRSFGIPQHYFGEVIEGVEMDLARTRFRDFNELRAYCYKVASVVGLICIEVFGYDDPRAKEYAVDLGIAMQLTNILRDVKEDADRGRIYIPLDEMASSGYSERELMDGVVNDAFRDLMKLQVDRARRYFDSGKRLIPLLSPAARACPAVLHGVYSTILSRIESSGFDVFERRIGLSKARKLFIMARLWAGRLTPAVPLVRR